MSCNSEDYKKIKAAMDRWPQWKKEAAELFMRPKKEEEPSPKVDVIGDLYMAFNQAQIDDPDIVLVMETPEGTTRCKIGEALIYIGMRDELVIDSE